MPLTIFSILSATALTLGLFYHSYVAPFVESVGVFRAVEPFNHEQCEAVEGLQACEKLVVHPSGLVYLACASSPYSRTVWMPTLDHLNATALRGIPARDYVATYEPTSRTVTRLNILGLVDPRGLNVHGMDVVSDESDPSLVWIYLVNHRPPLDPTSDATEIGADSVIEVFKTQLNSNSIKWVKTVSDSKIIVTPNDIVGGSNGKEFWFTNDHGVKVGMSRKLHTYLQVRSTSVGYCQVNTGCKTAADNLYSSNGIIRDKSGRFWVGSSTGGFITIHELQPDNTLVPGEVIKIGRAIDNLSLSSDGSIVAAAFPQGLQFITKAVKDVNLPSPVSAVRISKDAGESYKVEKIYESDGSMLGSAATTAAMYYDKLYLHGLMGRRMLICKISIENIARM